MTATAPDEVLRRRARALARPLESTEDVGATHQVMRFRLGEQGYVVPLDDIRQVVPLTGAARLPRAAWPLVALAPVGGRIVPVVALDRSTVGTGLPPGTAWALAVATGEMVVCLPADEVTELVDLRDVDVTVDGDGSSHARGLTRDGDVLIDVDGLLASVEGQHVAQQGGQQVEHRAGAAGPGDDV